MDIRLGSIPPDLDPHGDSPSLRNKRAKEKKPAAKEPAAEALEPVEDCYIPSRAGEDAE